MDLDLELNPDNFDEFGNYIGPELDDDAEEEAPVARPAMRLPAFDKDEEEAEEPERTDGGVQRMQIDGSFIFIETAWPCWNGTRGLRVPLSTFLFPRTTVDGSRSSRGQKVLSDRRRDLWRRRGSIGTG